jgi:hypothetical protein
MSLFLLGVALVCVLLATPLRNAFFANPVFNGMILAVLAIGVIINYRHVLVLGPEVSWIESVRHSGEGDNKPAAKVPRTRLLGSMARLLTDRSGERFSLSTMSMRTLLDGIRSRLDESRDLSRYFIGLLVFLGLLGTFWGLLDTLQAVGSVISNLSLQGQEAGAFFQELKSGLEKPIGGMGTAFSSSLFGLAGALILGFIDLQAGHAQNRFYNDLEEWLSAQTRFSTGALGADEGSVPAYIQALLEQTADTLEKLQRLMTRSEDERRTSDTRLVDLTEEISSLVDQSRSEQKGLMGLTRTNAELHGVLERLADVTGTSDEHDRDVRDNLRHIATSMDHLRQELSSDRERLTEDLREEVRILTRTVAHLRDSRE